MNGYAMEVFATERMREHLQDAENRRLLREAATAATTEANGGVPWHVRLTLAARRLARIAQAS